MDSVWNSLQLTSQPHDYLLCCNSLFPRVDNCTLARWIMNFLNLPIYRYGASAAEFTIRSVTSVYLDRVPFLLTFSIFLPVKDHTSSDTRRKNMYVPTFGNRISPARLHILYANNILQPPQRHPSNASFIVAVESA